MVWTFGLASTRHLSSTFSPSLTESSMDKAVFPLPSVERWRLTVGASGKEREEKRFGSRLIDPAMLLCV